MTARLESLTRELTSSNLRESALRNQIESFEDTIESFASVKTELESSVSNKDIEIKNLTVSLNSKLAEVEASVNRRVNSALASVGVTKFAVENIISDNNQSDKEVLNKFNSLTGDDKTKFYQANRAKITRALLVKN